MAPLAGTSQWAKTALMSGSAWRPAVAICAAPSGVKSKSSHRTTSMSGNSKASTDSRIVVRCSSV